MLVISAEGNETFAICKDDESRKDLLVHKDTVCLFAGDPNQGLCTYLNLAPNVETEVQKLNALDELIRKSWEIEALGLVEKAPRISNDHNDPSPNWTNRSLCLESEHLIEKLAVVEESNDLPGLYRQFLF